MARILLIEDDSAVRGSVATFLARMGHEVQQAADGEVALHMVSQASFDLVITDVNMPQMDGIEVLSALRGAGVIAPVIVMSGGGVYPKELLLASARALGAVSTLAKPFELDDLRRAVETALANSGPTKT